MTTKNKNRQDSHGFTLLELLVVVAIITILAGMLLPTLISARESGRSILCMNDLKQIGLAIEFYTQDSNDFLPWIFRPGNDPIIHETLNDRYIQNPDVFWCPSSGEATIWTGGDIRGNTRVSYGFNLNGTDPLDGFGYSSDYPGMMSATGSSTRWNKTSEIVNPSKLIASTDSDTDGLNDSLVQWSTEGFGAQPNPGITHRGGCNVLVADGHVYWSAVAPLIGMGVIGVNSPPAAGAIWNINGQSNIF